MNELPDTFNGFFNDKIELIRKDLNTSSKDTNACKTTFGGKKFQSFSGVTADEVKKIIMSMPKKSCELDPIPTDLLMQCLDETLPLITEIMNTSLLTGHIPSYFKGRV